MEYAIVDNVNMWAGELLLPFWKYILFIAISKFLSVTDLELWRTNQFDVTDRSVGLGVGRSGSSSH